MTGDTFPDGDQALVELARELGRAALRHGVRVITAESCTGGGLAAAITSVAGSSEWFDRGFVTYSNDAKQEVLGVRAETLARFGAVSEEVAREMAAGALRKGRGEVAIAVTGVAGPGGGSASKPVGLVCFGWCVGNGSAPGSDHCRFGGGRAEVRRQSILGALGRLRTIIDATA